MPRGRTVSSPVAIPTFPDIYLKRYSSVAVRIELGKQLIQLLEFPLFIGIHHLVVVHALLFLHYATYYYTAEHKDKKTKEKNSINPIISITSIMIYITGI